MAENRIDLVVYLNAQDNYSAQIKKLEDAIKSVDAQASQIRGTAFNAFSRDQIQPQIQALDEHKAKLLETKAQFSAIASTVPASGMGVQQLINQTTGASRAVQDFAGNWSNAERRINSASSSAKTLQTSLSAAAEADARRRDFSSPVPLSTVQGVVPAAELRRLPFNSQVSERLKEQEQIRKFAQEQVTLAEKTQQAQEAASAKGFNAASRDIEKEKQAKQRAIEQEGNLRLRALAQQEQTEARQNQQISKTFQGTNAYIDKQYSVRDRDNLKGYSAASRDAERDKKERQREIEQEGDLRLQSLARQEQAQEKHAQQVSKTFQGANAYIDRQNREREAAATKGFEIASREIEKEKQARQRAVEQDGNLRLRALDQQQRAEANQNKQISGTFQGANAYIDKNLATRQAEERKGYSEADAEARKQAEARKKEQEQILQANLNRAVKSREATQKEFEAAQREDKQWERARANLHRQAERDNRQFDKDRDRQYTEAMQENKERQQLAHKGYYSIVDPKEIRENDLKQQEILARMPSRRQSQAFYGEMAAEESVGSKTGFAKWFSGINRQGSLELQAALVNSVQAISSGMSPGHVLQMEGTQVAGGLIQGNLITLSQIFSALTNPIGLAITGLVALTAAIVEAGLSAARVANQFTGAQNAATAQGRNGAEARAEAEKAADQIRESSGLGRLASRTGAITISNIPNISSETRQSLYRSYPAVAEHFFKGDTEQADKFFESFNNPQTLQGEVERKGLLKGQERETFDRAVDLGDGLTASSMAAKALEERVKPTIGLLKEGREELGFWRRQFDIFGLRYSTILANKTGASGSINPLAGFYDPILQAGTEKPSEEEILARPAANAQLKAQDEISKLVIQRNQILADQEKTINPFLREKYAQALPEVEQKISDTHTPKEERAYNTRLETLQTQQDATERAANSDSSKYDRLAQIYKQIEAIKTEHLRSEAARREGITADTVAKQLQIERDAAQQLNQLEQKKLAARLSTLDVEKARVGSQDVAGQLSIARGALADVASTPGSAESQRNTETANVLNLERQLRLEGENLNIIQLKQNETLLQAQNNLEEILRLRKEEAAVIVKSPDRSPEAKAAAISTVVQADVQNEQRIVNLGLAQSGLQRAAHPEDVRAQLVAAQRELQSLQAPSKPVSDEQRIEKQKEVIGLVRAVALETENENIALLKQQEILADARGDLAEILRIHEKINQVIQSSNYRTDLEKTQSASTQQQNAVQVEQRQVNRGMLVSGLERAQNPANLGFQRKSLEEDLNNLVRSGVINEEQRLQKLNEIVHARQAEVMQAQNLQLLDLQENDILAQSRGQLDKIVDLRKRAAEIIKANPLNSDETKRQADIAVTQAEINSLEKAKQLRSQILDLQNRATESRFNTQKAALDLKAEQGTVPGEGSSSPKQDAIRQEIALSQQAMAVQQSRVQAELANNDLDYAQKSQLFSKLGDLYEQDAQKQLQLQRELTRAVQTENEVRTKHIKDFLKSTESGVEDVLANVLSRKNTFAEGMKDLRQGLISTATKSVTGMLSELAGKSLASSFGVKLKEGEDSSISNVLTKLIGSKLGLTKDEPKTDIQRISELTQKATNAQETAAKLLSEAARDLKAAAGNISGKQVNTSAPTSTLKDNSTYVDKDGQVREGVVERLKVPGPQGGDSGKIIASTLKDRGWTDAAVAGALNNSITESSLNPNATGKAGEKGLFQFHPKSHIGPFESQFPGDWSAKAQTTYMAQVVEKSMPGYSKSTDEKAATRDFVKRFEKPKDQSEAQVSARFANNSASQAIIRQASAVEGQAQVAKAVTSAPSVNFAPEMEDYRSVKPVAPFSPVAVGDSISAHLIRKAGVAGQEDATNVRSYRPGDTAVSGYTPTEIEGLIKKIPQEKIAGKDIILSSGASNNPGETGTLAYQIKELKDKQAQSVTVLGVGTRPDLAGVNERLAEISKENNVNFAGPMKDVAGDKIHSSNNQALLEQAKLAWQGNVDKAMPIVKPEIKPEEKVETKPESKAESPVNINPFADKIAASNTQLSTTLTANSNVVQLAAQAQVANQNTLSLASTETDKNTQSLDKLTESTDKSAQAKEKAGAGGNSTAASSGGGVLGGLSDIASVGLAAQSLIGGKSSPILTKALAGLSLVGNVSKLFSGGGLLGGLFGGGGAAAAGAAGTAGAATGGVSSLLSFLPFLALEGGGIISASAGAIVPQASIQSSSGGDVPDWLKFISPAASLFSMFSSKEGTVIPSAAGGLHVQETSLSSSIKTGLHHLAKTSNVGGFKNAQFVSHAGGAMGVNDGKGGRIAIVHPGELIVPQAETKMILNSMSGAHVTSSEAGGLVAPGSLSVGSAPAMPKISVSSPSMGFKAVAANQNLGSQGAKFGGDNVVSMNGDTHHHHYAVNISAIDSRSGAQFVMRHSDDIAQSLSKSRRSFNGRL